MKKILIWILVLTLIAVASAVATIAYFMYDTPLEENTMTVGNASIELVEYQRGADGTVERFVNDKILIPSTIADGFEYDAVNYDPKKITADTPCVDWSSIKEGYKSPIWDSANINDEVDKMVFVRNKGNTDVYVRVCFAFEAGNYVWLSHFDRMVHLNKNDEDWTWNWGDEKVVEINGTRYFIAWATYKYVLPAGEYTNISLSQIALDVSAISDHARAFGEKYEVMAFAQGIQADGFASASAAIAKGFDDTIPFKNVKEVNFVDLPTALHYLNGEKSDANKIISNVTSVTFGLTKDHSAKVVGREGVLVANKVNEADFTAYAYYVPNGENYDIYVLADEWSIYTPVSSEKLFSTMTSLTKVDTANLDVSKTTSMLRMFEQCSSLEEINVSNWDVSNVADMARLFQDCAKLGGLAVANWDVGNVESMNYIFEGCAALTSDKFNVSGWNVSNVKDFGGMFSGCALLTTLDLSEWKTGSATEMWEMFYGCNSLTTLEISNFNVSGIASARNMFNGCHSLAKIDLSGWNTANFNNTQNMFAYCYKLTTIYVGQGWNLNGVTESDKHAGMFSGDTVLKGGMGTTYNASEVDKDYARIDGGKDAPGYLTDIKDKPANP